MFKLEGPYFVWCSDGQLMGVGFPLSISIQLTTKLLNLLVLKTKIIYVQYK